MIQSRWPCRGHPFCPHTSDPPFWTWCISSEWHPLSTAWQIAMGGMMLLVAECLLHSGAPILFEHFDRSLAGTATAYWLLLDCLARRASQALPLARAQRGWRGRVKGRGKPLAASLWAANKVGTKSRAVAWKLGDLQGMSTQPPVATRSTWSRRQSLTQQPGILGMCSEQVISEAAWSAIFPPWVLK